MSKFRVYSPEVECIHCGKKSSLIAESLKLCLDCVREKFDEVLSHIEEVHHHTRKEFGLPASPPCHPEGIACQLCANECRIPSGEKSYCGLRRNEGGKLVGVSKNKGNLDWYYDNLPTNCVADWVCPGGSGAGYPTYSYSSGPEYGYKNLAVFFHGCSFNCLFCQNWHWRDDLIKRSYITPLQLAEAVDSRTACICYFGGDPAPQLLYALQVSRLALEENKDRVLRICWETNGAMSSSYLKKIADLSLKSGGCIKFDLKAWSESLHFALCGVSNRRVLENFAILASWGKQRPDPPFLIASTLLVPGYVDEDEVSSIAHFIASLNPNIPYSLLAFYPQFYMHNLPTTSRSHAERCKKVAEKEGLKRVRIGNLNLLSNAY